MKFGGPKPVDEMLNGKLLRKIPQAQCARCGGERQAEADRYCKRCRADYMREWRARQPSTLLALRYENERLKQELAALRRDTGSGKA